MFPVPLASLLARITDIKAAYSLDDFKGDGKVVKRGKKKFIKVVAK